MTIDRKLVIIFVHLLIFLSIIKLSLCATIIILMNLRTEFNDHEILNYGFIVIEILNTIQDYLEFYLVFTHELSALPIPDIGKKQKFRKLFPKIFIFFISF